MVQVLTELRLAETDTNEAVTAFLFASTPGKLLPIAYVAGTLATLTGLVLSFRFHLPTGPIIVCSFAMVLVAAFVVHRFRPAVHSSETCWSDST